MKIWHLLPTISAGMDFQMALDEFLFRSKERAAREGIEGTWFPVIRFFFASEPSITMGTSFKKSPGNDVIYQGRICPEISDKPLKIYPRITGGGFVKHGDDLLFSILARKRDDETFSSVEKSYFKIHEAVKEGLSRLGQKVDFIGGPARPRGASCFDHPIITDLGSRGRKIAGGAQKRSCGLFLHQESIQVEKRFKTENLISTVLKGFETVFSIKIETVSIDPEYLREAGKNAERRECLEGS